MKYALKKVFFLIKKKNSTEFIQIGKSSSAVIQQIDDTLLQISYGTFNLPACLWWIILLFTLTRAKNTPEQSHATKSKLLHM